MKSANSAAPRRLPWAQALALAILAGLIAYGVGRAGRKSPQPAVFEWSKLSGNDRDGQTDVAPVQGDRTEQVMRIRQRLLHRWRSSPDPVADWELMRETCRVMESLSVSELEAWFKEADHGLLFSDGLLKQELLDAWARKDGPGAVLGSGPRSRYMDNCVPAFIAWGQKDADAALLWLRDVALPAASENQRHSMRVNLLLHLAKSDLARVEQELPYMDAAERSGTLRALATNASKDPETQNRLRDLAAQSTGPDDALRMESHLLTRMSQTDADAAKARVDSMELEPARRAELECDILKGASQNDPETAFPEWLSRHPADQAIPAGFWPALNQSFNFDREEMTAWMDTLDAGPLRDQIHERGTRLIASTGDHAKAATYAAGIEDRGRRQAAMEILRVMWSERDPEGATRWLQSLSTEDRAMLER